MRLNAPAPAAIPGLAAWQRTLLAALWAPEQDAAQALMSEPSDGEPAPHQWRGLAAYRSHAALQAARTLDLAYPVTARMLGDENFAALARKLWREQPPARGDLAQWGGELARLIEALPDLAAAEPYLADVARTEWALHQSASAADGVPDPQSFALLASVDPQEVRLVLAPGTECIRSRWPVVTLVQAHRSEPPQLSLGVRCLAEGIAESALVWRQGYRPMLRVAQTGETAFIAALRHGHTLLEALGNAPEFDFNAWLVPAVQEGLLLRLEAGNGDAA